jgi:2-octaprenyl-6-methoxyphenol hydroxylase
MKIQQVRQHYDIVIVGGGLVGASFASALAAQLRGTGSSILVIEAAPTLQVSASFDVRSTALSHGSQRLYEQLGLWPAIASHATPIRRIHVSDRGRFGVVRLDSAQMQVDALGHVAENQPLGQVLTRALEEDPDIDLLSPASVSALTPLPRGMRLQGQGVAGALPAIETDLVVLADGGRSSLLDQLGIGCSQTPYGQHALIANVAFTEPHRHVAYERFTDTGPLAVLPLADDDEARARGALIWTLPDAEAQAVAELPEREFLSRLQERFGYRLGRFDKVGARAMYPLTLSVAREQVRPSLVLLGNVAHTLHPVAGQGLNLALRDAQSLAQQIARARAQGIAPGAMSVLQAYVAQQHNDQQLTIGFSDYMTRLFSSAHPALVWARKAGLFSIDLLPPVKKQFARRAMGLGERRTLQA